MDKAFEQLGSIMKIGTTTKKCIPVNDFDCRWFNRFSVESLPAIILTRPATDECCGKNNINQIK